MSFQQIINKYRDIAFSEHDKGNRFERLMQAYLKTDPKYAFFFKHRVLEHLYRYPITTVNKINRHLTGFHKWPKFRKDSIIFQLIPFM